MKKISKRARVFLRRCVDEPNGHEQCWLDPTEDPGPMLECRQAGLVQSDVSDVWAVWPTARGVRYAETMGASATTSGPRLTGMRPPTPRSPRWPWGEGCPFGTVLTSWGAVAAPLVGVCPCGGVAMESDSDFVLVEDDP